MKTIKLPSLVAAIAVSAGLLAGCESDDKVEHKVALHNLSSFTVTQRVATDQGTEVLTIEPGKKATFGGQHGETVWIYPQYAPSRNVIRIQENSHTLVFRDR